jgi:hypothetical protein
MSPARTARIGCVEHKMICWKMVYGLLCHVLRSGGKRHLLRVFGHF